MPMSYPFTDLAMRAIDHASVNNYANCFSALIRHGADAAGAAHWAIHSHSYGALRVIVMLARYVCVYIYLLIYTYIHTYIHINT